MSAATIPPQKQMTGMLGHPVAENPIDRMFDAVYAHYGLHWQFWKCDVAAADLATAIAGARALGFRGFAITVPYKVAAVRCLDAVDEDVHAIGAANYVTVEDGRLPLVGAPEETAMHEQAVSCSTLALENALSSTSPPYAVDGWAEYGWRRRCGCCG